YRWQRHVRIAAGVIVLVSLAVAALWLAETPTAARTRQGTRDLLGELLSSDLQTIEVSVPRALQARVGTLVYSDRADGVAQVTGRVVSVSASNDEQDSLVIRLSGANHVATQRGGTLQGAPAALSLSEAVQLLVSPDAPAEEAIAARDAIWPSIKTNVLPEIIDALGRELA